MAEWATAGELMQIDNPPKDLAGLRKQMAAFDPELRSSPTVEEVVKFLRRPPLPRNQMIGYRVLFAGAVASLEPRHREMLGLREPRLGPFKLPVHGPVKLVLRVIRFGLGDMGPSERSARERIARLDAETDEDRRPS